MMIHSACSELGLLARQEHGIKPLSVTKSFLGGHAHICKGKSLVFRETSTRATGVQGLRDPGSLPEIRRQQSLPIVRMRNIILNRNQVGADEISPTKADATAIDLVSAHINASDS